MAALVALCCVARRRERLELTPEDPRLWCALGDLSQDESNYHKAWDVSNGAQAPRVLCQATHTFLTVQCNLHELCAKGHLHCARLNRARTGGILSEYKVELYRYGLWEWFEAASGSMAGAP